MKGGEDAEQARTTGMVACRSLDATSRPHQSGCRDYVWFSASLIFPPMEWAVSEGRVPCHWRIQAQVK